ncbi:hypothetical protein ABK040_000646 [Willaertia magna]
METIPLTIGVLSLQGAFREHCECLEKIKKELFSPLPLSSVYFESKKNGDDTMVKIDLTIIQVKKTEQLDKLDGLIIPGGESTVFSAISNFCSNINSVDHLLQKIQEQYLNSYPIFGTCAGSILLAKHIQPHDDRVFKLNGLDVTISRNYFGRQLQSFEKSISVQSNTNPDLTTENFSAIFIRAPAIIDVHNDNVKVLASLKNEINGEEVIVAVEENNLLATTFHPELSNDLRFHKYFVKKCLCNKIKNE